MVITRDLFYKVNLINFSDLNKVDLVKANDTNLNKSNLVSYLEGISLRHGLGFNLNRLNGLNEDTVELLFNSISSKLVGLSNESVIQDYESFIKLMDFKSKGFINSSEPYSIPVIGELWDLLEINGELNAAGELTPLTEGVKRAVIQQLYHLATVIVLQRLVNKIIHLNTVDPSSEELTDFNVLLQEFMRKVDPRIRKYLKGSRINFIDKIYAGYDTEYETKEYGKVSLLSTQLSSTGTLLIRVNNIDKGFDFSKVLLSDGTNVKDFSFEGLLEKVPGLMVATSIIKSVIKELRFYMENSINDEFISQLKELDRQGLIYKTSEGDSVVEYMVPLLEEGSGVPKYVNNFKFHEAGEVNPTLTDVIDNITSSTTEINDERYVYFLGLLESLNKTSVNTTGVNITGINITDVNGIKVNINSVEDGGSVVTDLTSLNGDDLTTIITTDTTGTIGTTGTTTGITCTTCTTGNTNQNSRVTVFNTIDSINTNINTGVKSVIGVNANVITNTVNNNTVTTEAITTTVITTGLKGSDSKYRYIITPPNSVNPFAKDNKHPNTLSKAHGVLRGDHRRSKVIILGCHFSIADLSILSDFDSIKNKFDNIQNTLTTISKPYLVDKGRTVYLRDTMLLAPAGSRLEDLGVLYNIPKLSVGDYISRMTDLRDDNPVLFKEYAMRDAEITLRHIIEMEKASYKITGVGSVPTTLSSLARRFVFKYWSEKGVDLSNFINFGKYKIADFNTLYTPKALQSVGEMGLTLPLFMGGFRGGRNESYAYGVNRDEIWYDYDLTSAYTTAMSLLGVPDFYSSFHITTQKGFDSFIKRCGNPVITRNNLNLSMDFNKTTLENSYSIFHVEFKFPENVLYPCLPVSLDDTSTLYPLEGVSIATGYELFLAVSMGCSIKLKKGVIVPFKGYLRPYKDVVKYLQEQRRNYPKATLYNLLYKQLGNSIYGQTAQGFNKMKAFNSRTGNLENSGPSPLSNPLISSHISGLIRAVLGEVIRQVDHLNGKVVSCTTDGLITNLEGLINKLDYKSTLLDLFVNLRKTLSDSDEILELKDKSNGVVSWATRGQLGLNPESKISAMTGFQPRNHTMNERINLIVNAFNQEQYEIPFGQKSLRKVTDIYKYGGHVTTKVTEKVFRVVYDNRREIVETGVSPSMNLLFTKPFKDLDTALTINTISKLGGDLYAPNSSYINKSGSKNYMDLAIRSFIRALIQGKLNLINPFTSYQDIVNYVKNTFQFDITPNYIASQKRRAFIPKMVPNNRQTRYIVERIKDKFPDFNEKDFLSS